MAEERRSDAGLARLIEAGFGLAGTWALKDGIASCMGNFPDIAGVYVFIANGKICYVGSAQHSLQKRMLSYQRRQANRSSSRPVHASLTDALASGSEVKVYILAIAPVIEVGSHGLPINYLIGLEAGLIEKLDPTWNRRGRKAILEERPLYEPDEK